VKIASIEAGHGPTLGLLADDDLYIDLSEVGPSVPRDLRQLLDLGPEAMADIASSARRITARLDPTRIRFQPLIRQPQAVWCAALNYQTHVTEGNWEQPSRPPLFLRVAESLCGHEEPLVRPAVSDRLDYEGELAVIIGARARHVPVTDAHTVIAGYSCFNDGSIRDWQRHTAQITSGKNFWRTGPFGPWLTTPDEVPDIESRQLTTRLNGRTMQQAKIGEMIFGIPELVNYISTMCELVPGDVIVTGTPGGVGARQDPPVFMLDGDVIEVEVDGVGLLRNSVVDEAVLGR
jgi:2-keto-4-pentenoate hydratase/2-oxohepta-3-ene-1,7-dioic acid hydratase in catechol pathway